MRAATWATNRDINAARLSWERAQTIADRLPAEDPNRATMRIAPRTMLCGIAWRIHARAVADRFDELRELCAAVGDKVSLAIGMAGLVMEHAHQARAHEAAELASEAWTLAEALGDSTLTVGLSVSLMFAKMENNQWSDVLRWSQTVIKLADGDPSKGNFIIGSPLAVALAARAIARYSLGLPGWPDDQQQGLAMARKADPMSYALVVAYIYNPGIPLGVLAADDRAVHESEDALRIIERSGDDVALAFTQMAPGVALVHRPSAADRERGQQLLADLSDVFRRRKANLGELRFVDAYLARERARGGDRDDAVSLVRAAVNDVFREGQPPCGSWGFPATGVLVETLLDRGTDADVAEAEAAIERLAAAPTDGLAMRDIWLLRLNALVAQARGDATAYADLKNRYTEMATSLQFAGHIAWAEAMA
jgi:hypothetical protein